MLCAAVVCIEWCAHRHPGRPGHAASMPHGQSACGPAVVLAQNAQSLKESWAHELVQWCRCPGVAGSRAAQSVLQSKRIPLCVSGRGRAAVVPRRLRPAVRRDRHVPRAVTVCMCRPSPRARPPRVCAVARFHSNMKRKNYVKIIADSISKRCADGTRRAAAWADARPHAWSSRFPGRRSVPREVKNRGTKPPPGDRTRHVREKKAVCVSGPRVLHRATTGQGSSRHWHCDDTDRILNSSRRC